MANNGIDLKRVSSSGNPASTHDRLWNDTNGTLYFRDSNGVQNQLSPSSGASGANTALSNLASVAINTSLISDTDSADDLGSTSIYWRNAYIDTMYLSEQAAPSNPASGKYAVYPKTDGTLYGKNDDGVEIALAGSGGGMTSFTMSDGSNNETIANGNTQTFASGVAINGTVSATDTVTHNWDLTKLSSANGTMTNADYFGIYDLSGVAHQRIALADLPTITSIDSTNDKFPVVDATDNRLKLVAGDNLPGGATVVSANKVYKFASNQTTTSNTMVDVDATNAAITATLTGGGKCVVTFNFACFKSVSGSAFFQITDGTNSSAEVEIVFVSGIYFFPTLTHVFDTSAGSTTYKLQYRSNNANAATLVNVASVSMSLMEIA